MNSYKFYRCLDGKSQAEVSKIVGVSRLTIIKLESGRDAELSDLTRAKIGKYYKIQGGNNNEQ